jgi:hypothetical protein
MSNELSREQIDSAIGAAHTSVTSILAGVSAADWTGVTRDDGWTIHDIASHIADGVFGIVFALTQAMPGGAPFDIDAINAQNRQASLGKPRAEIMGKIDAAFGAARGALAQAELANPGPFGPGQTVGQGYMFITVHTDTHLQELHKLVGVAA